MKIDNDMPLLRHWRMVAGAKLVGEVEGHPWLADGWMITSRLLSPPDRVTRTARCESRVYRLGEPWPPDEPMPSAALEIVVRAIFRNLSPVAVEDLANARHAAATLADKGVQPGEDPWSGFIPPDSEALE